MKNKLLGMLLTLCMVITIITVFIAQAEPTPNYDIVVKVNDKPITFDVKPTIINDRTMVPLRAIFEALGAQVTWDGDTNTIYSSKANSIIILQINNKMAFVNSTGVTLDVAPQIIEDRTLVPVRFIAEALGADVQWDGEKNMVIINTNEVVGYKKITPDQAKQVLENKSILLIDVRTSDEYKAGHIKGSVNITNTELKSKITQFASDKATEIIVYCRSGARSKVSAEELLKMGYTNVSDLGGIIDWKYETESGMQ